MVRSESADEEMVMMDTFDDVIDDDDFAPRTIWTSAASQSNAGYNNNNANGCRPPSRSASSLSPTSTDPERRLRRQIANCNERRRMQSINAGFSSLRALLPHKEGEKLSKAAILQQTADLIHQLQTERAHLLIERDTTHGGKKPKLEVDDDDARHAVTQLQLALERERSARLFLEQQVTQLREICHSQGTVPPAPTAAPASPVELAPAPAVETSIIRPTPLPPPLSVDVSSCRVSAPLRSGSSPLLLQTAPLHHQLSMASANSAFTSSSISAHRSLQTILDAIRHLEGGHLMAPSPPPSSQAPLVR